MRLSLGIVSLAFCLHAGDTFVPVVTNEAVDGAAQRVGLKVRNLETRPVQLDFRLLRAGEGEPLTAQRMLDPLATLSLTDALNDLFPGADATGSLKISADGMTLASAARLFQKESRTYGVALAAVSGDSLTVAGAVADAPWLPASGKWDSSLWLMLEGDSAGTLVVYDALGTELARRDFDGVSKTLRFAPADLVTSPPEVVRVQIRMNKGQSTSFVETVLKSTGDRSGYPAVEVAQLPRDVAFQPALRSATVQGYALTSIVMFNPWASQQTVSLSFAGVARTVALRPFEVKEIVDVVSTLFGRTDTASVLFSSAGWPVFLLGRSDMRPEPAGETMASEMSLAADPDAMPAVGETAYLLPPEVPDAGLAFIASTREDASRGVLQRDDKAGLPEGTPGSYDLPDFSFWQTLLNIVAPGANGSTPVVTLKPETGAVRAAVQSYLPVSGDSLWVEAQTAGPAPDCLQPVVNKLSASAYTLAQPGQVAVTWDIAKAETLELLPAGTVLPEKGTLNVDIEASTEFTFRASNACGTTEAPLFISVGAPQATGAAAGFPGETKEHGSPGELLTVTFDNLAEPELIESVTVTTAQGVAVPVTIRGRGERGEVFALVPYITVGSQPQQVTGEVQIRAVLADGGTSNAVPFTIDPLSQDGDAVTETRTMFDSIASWMSEMATEMRAQGLEGVDDLVTNAAREEGELRQMLASIETTGKAVISWNGLPLDNPKAIGVEVTQADLAALMAYNRSAGAAWRALLGADVSEDAPAAARRLSAMPRNAGGTCLAQKVQLLEPCLKNDYRRKFEAAVAEHLNDFLFDIDKDLPPAKDELEKYLKDKLAKRTIGALAKRLYKWLDYLTVACQVAPIQLDSFEVQTQGRLISKAPPRNRPLQTKEVLYSKYDNMFTVVRVIAVLVPEIPDGDVKSRARSAELALLRAALKAKGVDEKTADFVANWYDQTFESDPFMDELVRLAQKYRTTTRNPQQVGACDLEHVYPKRNGPGVLGNPDVGYRQGHSILKLYTGRQSGEDDYFYTGKLIRRRESLCIIPKPGHFLFNDKGAVVEARRLKNDPCAFHDEVRVRGRAVGLGQRDAVLTLITRPRIYSDRVFVGPGEARAVVSLAAVGAPSAPNMIATPPINTTNVNLELDRDAPFVRKDGGGPATARVEARQTGDLTWTVKLNSAGKQEPETLRNGERRFYLWSAYSMIEVFVTYPAPPREIARRVVLTGKTQTDDMCQMFIRLGDGTQNKSVSGLEGSLSLDLDSTGPINIVNVRINVYYPNRGFQGPFVSNSGSCSGEAEIKIIEEEDTGPPPA